jgi:hypothetical protein
MVERKWGEVVKCFILVEGKKKISDLKVHRQCPLVLLVEVRFRKRKITLYDVEFSCEQRRELEQFLYKLTLTA